MLRKVIIVLLFISILPGGMAAGAYKPLKIFSRAEGLPGNRVHCIFQDKEGAVWVGTEGGAAKYEGHHWEAFTTREGLPGPVVYSITQDGDGSIWLGTSGGICRYSGRSWDRMGRLGGTGSDGRVAAVKDAEGMVWFGAGDSLHVVDLYENEISRLENIPLKDISSLFLDRDNQLWVTSAMGAARYDGFQWKEYNQNDGLPPLPIRAGFQDDEGAMWFATAGGLVEYNGFTFRTLKRPSADFPSDDVSSINQDGRGRLWIGTSGGPAFFDGSRWKQPDGLEQWPDLKINALHVDQGGNLWLGTDAGVIFMDLSWEIITDETFDLKPHHPFLRTSEDILWYTVREGLESLDGRIVESWGERDGFEGMARVIFEDTNGDIWIGTDNGVYRYDHVSFESYREPEEQHRMVQAGESLWINESYRVLDIYDGLTGDVVNAFLQDEEERIWIATSKGLSALDGDRWTLFEDQPGLDQEVLSLAGEEDAVWAGMGKGLMKYAGETWQPASTESGLEESRVTALLLENGRLWAGTETGLWNFKDGEWIAYYQEDGLLSDYVTSLAKSDDGLLWVGSRAGLSIFDGVNWSSFSQKDGLPSQEVLSVKSDGEGRLLVAGDQYLTVYHYDTIPPQTYIKNPPSEPVGAPQYLFEFYGADLLSEPFDLRYSYRLDGGEWSPFSREPLVTISDMANGTHTFEVRALDRGLNADPTPAVAMFEVNTALFDIDVRNLDVRDLYSSLYHYYASDFDAGESPVGSMTLFNKYDRTLKVKVGLTIPAFMDFPTDRIVNIKPNEEITLPLRLELNENILGFRENSVEQLIVNLQYYIQGQLKENKFSRGLTIYGRNAMFWDDPGKISLFVTHLDPEIESLSKKILAAGKDLEGEFILDNNFIRAVGLFNYLGHAHISYIPDPDHPYTGFSSVKKTLDFIRYPRETLALESGDCDDISTLFAAMLQSSGIDTALVDVFDHVFLMFDTGLKGEEYRYITPDRNQVYFDEESRVWVPVETTLVGQPFIKAWETGVRELARESKNIIVVKDAWKTYQPVLGAAETVIPDRELNESSFLDKLFAELSAAEDALLMKPFSELRQKSDLEPGNYMLLNKMGIILGRRGYLDMAEHYFKKAISIEPDFPGGYSNMANIYYERGEFQKAVESYKAALKLDPDNYEVHIEIALTYAEKGEFDRAREHYLKAVGLNPALIKESAP